MKKIYCFLIMCVCIISITAQNIDLSKYVWQKTATTYDRRVNGVDNQGGAYYNGKYYQFYDKAGGIKVFDVETMTFEKSLPMTCDGNLHFGSVTFSNEFSYIKDGVTTEVQIPLIYATGHYNAGSGKKEIVDVIDVENNVLVRKYEFPERRDDAIAAWDFSTGRFWIIGYEPVNGYAETPYYINEYKWNEDGTYSEVGDVSIVEITKSTLQDCYYKDGHIYILAGWGKNGQVAEIHDYNTETKLLDYTLKSTSSDEAEGFAYVPETNSFIVTTWTRGGSKAYYWHVALPGTKPYYVTLDKENRYDFSRYNVDSEKNYEVYDLTFDDMADNLNLPSDANSISAVNINYSRAGVCGYNSVCMPFALTPSMLPSDEYKIYTIKERVGNTIILEEKNEGVEAGVPCLVKAPQDITTTWTLALDATKDNCGELYTIVTNPANESTNLVGSFVSTKIGEGYYKLDDTGTAFVKTNGFSYTYPFRCYLDSPSGIQEANLRIVVDEVNAIDDISEGESYRDNRIYTIDGIFVGYNLDVLPKGMYIKGGKKYVK